MSKETNKIISKAFLSITEKVAKRAASNACIWFSYQPIEPDVLKKMRKKDI